MKNPFLGLRTCIFKVSNIIEAKEWYSTAFNCKPYFDEAFYVGFNIQGFELGLQPAEIPNIFPAENVLCYWGVEDIASTYNHLLDIGATEHEAPQHVGGDIVVASVRDPWSNVIGIIYNPNFKIVTGK
jgi:lactoylglutathione lyase